ncbi:MAG: hypothetical protein OXC44_03025 [Proteobacteria bacterium]|nr:hypothetical protein [Pseudomonadota bacterium]
MGLPERIVKYLIQIIVWTVIFSIPYKDGRLFDFSRSILFENAVVETFTNSTSEVFDGLKEFYTKYLNS